eukprot:8860907-Karenia_brevis.AAC.1
MVAEQSADPEKQSKPEEKPGLGFLSKSSDEEFMRMMRAFFKTMIETDKGNTEKRNIQTTENRIDNHKSKLEEKYFRRIDKYDGNPK